MDTETKAEPAITSTPPRRQAVVTAAILDDPDLIDKIFEFIAIQFPELGDRAGEMKRLARKEFAGIETYIPRRSQAERDRIAREVMAAFDGSNATAVGRRLGISRSSVYRIIKTDSKK